MRLLIITGQRGEAFRRGIDEFVRRARHAGWHSDRISLDDFAQNPSILSDYDDLAVAGGDGTVKKLLELEPARPIVIIPAGTGNDFARSLGISSLSDSIRHLVTGYRERVDLGHVVLDGSPELFANGVGIGLDGEVCRMHADGIPYSLGAAYSVLKLPEYKAFIEVEGQREEVDFTSLLVANGGYFGGGFHLAPNASLTDGKLEMILTAPMSRAKYLTSLPKARQGKHLSDDKVRYSQITHVTVTSTTPLPLHVDGEYRTAKRIEISVVPGRRWFYLRRLTH